MENIHDVPTALSECDTLKTGEYTKDVTDCYRGVFSENADVVIADGGKTSDLLAFCSSLEERLQVYCAMELNGLHVGHGASAADIEKGFAQCVEDAYADVIKEGCIRSVTWVITDNILSAQHDLTPSAFVQTLPDSLRLVYIEATYGSFLKTAAYRKDLSFDSFCSLLSDPGDKDFCHSLPTRMSGGA